ncbi:transforming growth factor beta regulator 1-like [Physella acuta]|uniref:transforming growth factor beta regulator 1-like n=1 Tax=Physella acuta TaxID=109671 RepID=UPI0027DCF858|nr:transforming growth factor beta regulator 1-like [Physella acuta]
MAATSPTKSSISKLAMPTEHQPTSPPAGTSPTPAGTSSTPAGTSSTPAGTSSTPAVGTSSTPAGTSSTPAGTSSTPADVQASQKLFQQLIKEKQLSSAPGPGPSAGPSSAPRAKSSHQNMQDLYAKKLRKLKRAIKDAIFENGAICDEVLRTEEKLAKAKEERRFLLRKVLQYQSANEPNAPTIKLESQVSSARQSKGLAGTLPVDKSPSEYSGKPKAVKRKLAISASSPSSAGLLSAGPSLVSTGTGETKKKMASKESSDTPSVRPKKGKGAAKKMIPPLMLDSLGRPIFPMVLGDITLHSIGEIVPDRLSFHSLESIYPVGFCITRVYASLHKLDTKCLYTCKISDNNEGPLFEIAAEDSSEILFKSTSPVDCHTQLIRAVNKSRGTSLMQAEGQGLAFFGLSHPVIQNLIQSCPGARKCSRYKWVKFEINKAETNENVAVGTTDPAISYDAFKAHMQAS